MVSAAALTDKDNLVRPRHDRLCKVDELPVLVDEVASVLVYHGRADKLEVECPVLHVFWQGAHHLEWHLDDQLARSVVHGDLLRLCPVKEAVCRRRVHRCRRWRVRGMRRRGRGGAHDMPVYPARSLWRRFAQCSARVVAPCSADRQVCWGETLRGDATAFLIQSG